MRTRNAEPLVSTRAEETLQGLLHNLGRRRAVVSRPFPQAGKEPWGQSNRRPPEGGGAGTCRNLDGFGSTQMRLQTRQSDVFGVRRGDHLAQAHTG